MQVFGASATALYGINLLLNPVPPEQYKLYPEGSPAGKQKGGAGKADGQKKRWWRRKGKQEGKEAESEVSDVETATNSKVRRLLSAHGRQLLVAGRGRAVINRWFML